MKKALSCIIFLFFAFLIYGEETVDPRITPTVKAVAKALPSVVNIGTERIVTYTQSPWGSNDPYEQLFRNFYAKQKGRKETSLGSGAIISEKGLIVTNSHVVHRATKIIVTTSDGKQYLAKEIAGDTMNDIALLQIINSPPGTLFKPISCAKPDSLILGEPVIAVGNPFGLGSSISRGVLSATERKISFNSKVLFSDILQTDAAINPGNSGGPLININGKMIGINTAIYGEADGIGFAIPLKRIERVIAQWMIPEKFRDVTLGIVPGEKLVNNEVEYFIKEVLNGSPAFKAGIKKGDVIKKINDNPIKSILQIGNIICDLKSGDSVSFDMLNKGRVTLKIEKLKILDGKDLAKNRLGLGLEKLTLKLAKGLQYPFHGGLLVNEVGKDSKNIRRGDVLVRINNIPIYDFSDISRSFQNKHYGDNLNGVVVSVVKKNGRTYISKRAVVLKVK